MSSMKTGDSPAPTYYQSHERGRGHDPQRGRDPQQGRDPGRSPTKEFTVITAVTNAVGTMKNAVSRSRTPPLQRTWSGSHHPSVQHSGPIQYPVSAYYSAPIPHQSSSHYEASGAPGMMLPPVANTEGRNEPASSSYCSHNASDDADVYQIRAPPPGSSQDDDTGPSAENLVMAVMAVKSAVNHFANTLISDMNKYPEELKHLRQRIRDEVQGDVDRANHWKFLVQAFICQRMFEGFEAENGFFGIEHFDAQKMSTFISFADFTKYKDKAATISELFARNSEDRSFLGRYCFMKLKAICVDPVTKHSLAIYEQEWSWVEAERHPQSEFYQSFLKVAVSVWLLHRLVHSFEQGWSMLGWATFPKGNKFSKKNMESVAPGGYEEEDDETGTDVNRVVGFLVIPGFQVSKSVVKCEVYLRNKNNLTDGKITEAGVQSIEKSSSDKTPANYQSSANYSTLANYPTPGNHRTSANYPTLAIYQTSANNLIPRPGISMDRSRDSRGSLKSSSNFSGHSSRGAENVEASSNYSRHSQTREYLARSKSSRSNSDGHSPALVHILAEPTPAVVPQPTPPVVPKLTPPVAPQHAVKTTKTSRKREEKAVRLREEERRRNNLARFYLKDAEESMKAVQKMLDLLKFNNEQSAYLHDKLCVVIESANSFLKLSGSTPVGTTSSNDSTNFVEIFELLMVLGKQIESFVGGFCRDDWIQAAMVLTNVSEYVSSLGFNLDLCKVALGEDRAASGCLTLDEVDSMNKSEVELVKTKASVDARRLTEKVILALNSLHGEDRDLVSHLLQRLLGIDPSLSSANETLLSNLFAWVETGDQVGRGASATIYKAMWLGTRVAMKTFSGSGNVDFEKEVQILSRLCHPNITSMFCCAKNERNCSIIMELMDGDLSQLMDKRCEDSSDSPPFPILEAVDIMLQIGEGVNYLHNQGIVHQDLKSRNILYMNAKVKNAEIGYVQVKVADFGISKARDTNTTCSELTCNTGTNRWMPPEIIGLHDGNEGGLPSKADLLPKYPFKLDSYSFGLVCYEVLVGHEPFWECDNPIEVKRRILNKERPILPCKSSECPLMLRTLIENCWSHEPKERPTFAEICRELKYLKYSLMTGG